jgi:hypothetical protein
VNEKAACGIKKLSNWVIIARRADNQFILFIIAIGQRAKPKSRAQMHLHYAMAQYGAAFNSHRARKEQIEHLGKISRRRN